MQARDIIVIGASAGGVEAVSRLAAGLPADLPAAVFVVVHFPETSTSVLPQILSRSGPLPAHHAEDDEPILPGRIYVAEPGAHLMLNHGRVRCIRGPRENRHRPAIDPLFRTAARAYGPRVAGVILSGTLDDGTAGLREVKRNGGLAVVQSPASALYTGMIESALAHVEVDHVAPLAELPGLLAGIAAPSGRHEVPAMQDTDRIDPSAADNDPLARDSVGADAPPSAFTCPDCHGTLFEVHEGGLKRFRCRVGHGFTPDILLSVQGEALEAALWTALRSLEEHAALARRLAANAASRDHRRSASTFTEQAIDAEHHADVIRQVLHGGGYASGRESTVTAAIEAEGIAGLESRSAAG